MHAVWSAPCPDSSPHSFARLPSPVSPPPLPPPNSHAALSLASSHPLPHAPSHAYTLSRSLQSVLRPFPSRPFHLMLLVLLVLGYWHNSGSAQGYQVSQGCYQLSPGLLSSVPRAAIKCIY